MGSLVAAICVGLHCEPGHLLKCLTAAQYKAPRWHGAEEPAHNAQDLVTGLILSKTER